LRLVNPGKFQKKNTSPVDWDGNGTQVSILYDSLMRPTDRYGVQGAWTLSDLGKWRYEGSMVLGRRI